MDSSYNHFLTGTVPPEERRSRCYPYPRHFLYTDMLFFSLVSGLAIFAWIPALLSLFTYGAIISSALRAAIFMNFTAGCLILSLIFIKRELRQYRFVLSDRSLTRKGLNRERSVSLNAIREVLFIRLPGSGGMILVESDTEKIRIPLFVDNIGDLVSRLEHICKTVVPSCSTGEDTWRTIKFFSGKYEMVSTRVRRVFRPLMTLCIAMLPISTFVGVLFWNMSIVPLLLWGIISPFFPMAAYAAGDIILRIFTPTEVRNRESISDNEKAVFVRSGLFFLILYLITGIVIKALIL